MTHAQNPPDNFQGAPGGGHPITPPPPPGSGGYPPLPGDAPVGYGPPQDPYGAPPPQAVPPMPQQYPAGQPGVPPPMGWHSQAPQPPKKGAPVGLIIGVVAAVVVLLVGLVVVGVFLFASPADPETDQGTASSQVDVGAVEAGLTQGTGPVEVHVYLDFMCTHCADFHTSYDERLTQEAEANSISVTYHPLGMLDGWSAGSEYSTRAAAASACAAAEGGFAQYSAKLFESVPAEGAAGPDDSALAAMGDEVGLSPEFGDCVLAGTYRVWAADVTDGAAAAGVGGIPHVTINGNVVATIHDFGTELDQALADG
jgi:protein-disulfide isomerase